MNKAVQIRKVRAGDEQALAYVQTESWKAAFKKIVPADLLSPQLDTCWVNVAGVNPAEYIEKYSGRSPVVHLKDFKKSGNGGGKLYQLIGIDDGEDGGEDEAFSFMPVGYGVQDMPEILAACENAGAEWVVVEQDQPSLGKTPLECAKMSIDYIKEINK